MPACAQVAPLSVRAALPPRTHPAGCVPFTAVWFRTVCPGFVRQFGRRKLPLSWVARGGSVLGVDTGQRAVLQEFGQLGRGGQSIGGRG